MDGHAHLAESHTRTQIPKFALLDDAGVVVQVTGTGSVRAGSCWRREGESVRILNVMHQTQLLLDNAFHGLQQFEFVQPFQLFHLLGSVHVTHHLSDAGIIAEDGARKATRARREGVDVDGCDIGRVRDVGLHLRA